ncbi:MAG: hypothetical protein V3T72_11880 [Thermoanaerobaculia bacterium]
MLEHEAWHHPTQVLERPRPDFDKLLAACQARLERTREEHRSLVGRVTVKVERAARIAEGARKKREKMRRRRERSETQS